MGNSKSKRKQLEATKAELSQPGQPRISLNNDRRSPVESEVSDEVVLSWSPCTHTGRDLNMWTSSQGVLDIL